jgi:hypothetical protein
MRIKCLTTVVAMVSFGLRVHAQNTYAQTQTNPPVRPAEEYTGDYVNHIGVGFQLGAPIGVSAKYWLNDRHAVDGAFGYSPYGNSTVEMHADFLFNNFNCFTVSSGRMPLYYGPGILLRIRDDGRSSLGGLRFPVGVSYMFDDKPFDIYAELAPEIIFAPFARGGIDGAVGFHYWF